MPCSEAQKTVIFIIMSTNVSLCTLVFILKVLLCLSGFVAAHTLPVLYERYDVQIDSFVYNVFDQFQNHYKKLDSGVLSNISKGKFKLKKHD